MGLEKDTAWELLCLTAPRKELESCLEEGGRRESAGKEEGQEGQDEGQGGDQVFVVGYEGDKDPLNLHNWSYWTKAVAMMMIAAFEFVVGVASSIDSSAIREAAAKFGASEVAESLVCKPSFLAVWSGTNLQWANFSFCRTVPYWFRR